MELLLKRTYYPAGTNGMLFYNDSFQCYTIELPWLDNKPQQSCIPEGRYRLVRRNSPKHGSHFLLLQVPGRDLVLIHPANDAVKELKGCIAPVSMLTGEEKGSWSRKAFDKIKALVKKQAGDTAVFITIKST